ncbi:MAG TPA: hypothetical protein ENJ86_10275 [Methylothermaceae bacterium]|nr:hypothetical protein [Methylothermaceae bacterium]
MAAWVNRQKSDSPLVLGINGAQGSGKSTLAALLQTILADGFQQRVAGFSVDDIYKTRAQREQLAKTVHPLLITRGVPGTHDVALGIRTIEALKQARPTDEIPIPAFDKAIDDRKPVEEWPIWKGPVDIILFEGWCVGARPQPEAMLADPVNELEAREDPDGTWRRYVNDQLKGPYQALFALLDRLIMLKVPDMAAVFRWRLEQERKLAELYRHNPGQRLKLMNENQLRRFIQHYERLTRWMLEDLPSHADIVLHLNHAHQIHQIQVNTPPCQP